MAEPEEMDETLMRLAQAGVASHHLSFPDGLAAKASQDDEVAALEALAELVEGPIYRIDALNYAFECTTDPEALARAFAEKLGADAPPVIAPLPEPAEPPERRSSDMLTLLGALARPDAELSGDRRVVIDAGYAAATAEATAARIGELVDRLEERLNAGLQAASTDAAEDDGAEARVLEALARIEAALSGQDGDAPDEAGEASLRLGRIEEALAALAAPAEHADVGARLERIDAALAALAPGDGDGGALPDRLARMETALEALAAPAPEAEQAAERLARIEASLSALASSADAAPAHDAEAAFARLEAALAARPVADHELTERMDRIERALATLSAAPPPEPAVDPEAIARLEQAVTTIAARLDEQPAAAQEALAAAVAASEARLEAFAASQSAALEALAERLAALDGMPARFDAVDAAIAAQAAADAPPVELTAEREALASLSAAVQAMLERMDAEVTRLVETAQRSAAEDDESAQDPVEILGPRLEQVEASVARAASELRAAIEASGGAGAASEIIEEVRALASRPAAPIDLHREREGLTRLSSALQTMLGRMDGEITRLVEAQASGGQSQQAIAARLDRTIVPRFDALEARLAEIASAHGAGDISLAVSELRAALERHGAGGTVDMRRERESLARLSFGLQTVASRLEAEVSRLAGGEGLSGEALRDALAPLDARLQDMGERIQSVAGMGADQTAALVDMVERVRTECANLNGLHARLVDGASDSAGADAAEALMERMSVTLAEFLARMERMETARSIGARPAAPRLGRAL